MTPPGDWMLPVMRHDFDIIKDSLDTATVDHSFVLSGETACRLRVLLAYMDNYGSKAVKDEKEWRARTDLLINKLGEAP